jgi:hypothetical protein
LLLVEQSGCFLHLGLLLRGERGHVLQILLPIRLLTPLDLRARCATRRCQAGKLVLLLGREARG